MVYKQMSQIFCQCTHTKAINLRIKIFLQNLLEPLEGHHLINTDVDITIQGTYRTCHVFNQENVKRFLRLEMQKVKDENGMPNDLTLQIFFIGTSHKVQKKMKR